MLILVVGNVVNNLGHGDWVLPSAMIIIGLHFLPLAWTFTYPTHVVTGVALVLWGATNPMGCLGAGLILWATAIKGLLSRPGSTTPVSDS